MRAGGGHDAPSRCDRSGVDGEATLPVVALLERAAALDADLAQASVAARSDVALLDLVVTQATHAVTPGRRRCAGIDALAAADRARQELVAAPHRSTPAPAGDVVGWELVTADDAEGLVGATWSLAVRPWVQAVVAFTDLPMEDAWDPDASSAARTQRQVTAVATDGRLVTCSLRLAGPHDRSTVAVLGATVSTRWEDLGADPALAWGLASALVRGRRGSVAHRDER
jgi:hypothetical protein